MNQGHRPKVKSFSEIIRVIEPVINYPFKLDRFWENDESIAVLYRTILDKLPVIVVDENCTRSGFFIKGVWHLLSRQDLLRLSKRTRMASTYYFYFQAEDRAYIDKNFAHFFEDKKRGRSAFSGTWSEVLVEISQRLSEHPEASEWQKKLIKTIKNSI
jgi:hypothetical protein